ncbi:MAG TPA: class I SAM-dependent methyltransferase, partial [Candidatus Omnitrophota bacterium]|nr:class I SAM-dependent methyltransferase [Candidatus Omnitrophota bacterium]
ARWKAMVRRFPALTRILQFIFDPAHVNPSARKALINSLPEDAVILNIGAGVKKYPRRCVNVDINAFGNVDVVADAQRLPFQDNTIDLCLMEYVVEHVPYSDKMKAEIYRVLKKGGCLYATVPFMQSYHGNPDDYYRFTVSGLPVFFSQFEKLECQPFGGPASALCNAVKEFLAIALSFNNKVIYAVLSQVFIIPVFPFKYLDCLLAKSANAHHLAFSFYYIGRKKG